MFTTFLKYCSWQNSGLPVWRGSNGSNPVKVGQKSSSPAGFVKWVFGKPSAVMWPGSVSSFIFSTKVSTLPATYSAIAIAASFPDGYIKPRRRLSNPTFSPTCRETEKSQEPGSYDVSAYNILGSSFRAVPTLGCAPKNDDSFLS